MPLRFHEDALSGVAASDSDRVLEKIEWLWANRLSVTHHPLKENLGGFYKRRLRKYRIIYTYDNNPDEMVIRLVGTRDDIYEEVAKG
jgi:mRNA-degrading endonuclease RelE of RelBE toxin-antitoxin system